MKVDAKPWSLYPLETRGLNSKKGNGPGSLLCPLWGLFLLMSGIKEKECLLVC